MDFERYLAGIPNLHSFDGGKTWCSGGFDATHLSAFYELVTVKSGANITILETGAGNSTLAFLIAQPKKLISIAPDPQLFERIKDFCNEHEVNMTNWDYHVERSEWTLPELAKKGLVVDIALIDGCHNWPSVFVDFCYINAMMPAGGLLIIDDIQLHTAKELGRLLVKDKERFSLELNLGNALVFKKLTEEQFLPEWGYQPYIVEQSRGMFFSLESMAEIAVEEIERLKNVLNEKDKVLNEKNKEIYEYCNHLNRINASPWWRLGMWLNNNIKRVT